MSSCPYHKSLTDSLTHDYAKCDNPVIGSTNDPHIPNPYRLTRAHCKCQWATNPESIPTPITKLEVYVLIVCLIWVTELFGLHCGSLTPIHNFWLSVDLLHPKFQAFHLRRLTAPFLLRPTHINFIFICFILFIPP